LTTTGKSAPGKGTTQRSRFRLRLLRATQITGMEAITNVCHETRHAANKQSCQHKRIAPHQDRKAVRRAVDGFCI
jgi:hypothetical protein